METEEVCEEQPCHFFLQSDEDESLYTGVDDPGDRMSDEDESADEECEDDAKSREIQRLKIVEVIEEFTRSSIHQWKLGGPLAPIPLIEMSTSRQRKSARQEDDLITARVFSVLAESTGLRNFLVVISLFSEISVLKST